jgi:hypothetical protein
MFGGFHGPGLQMMLNNAFGQIMFGNGGGHPAQMLGHMMFGGGPPPSSNSEVGRAWDMYMKYAISAPFPHSFQGPSKRHITDLWTGRKIIVHLPEVTTFKHGIQNVHMKHDVKAEIVSLCQFNRSPFDSNTSWALEIKYEDPHIHMRMLGKYYQPPQPKSNDTKLIGKKKTKPKNTLPTKASKPMKSSAKDTMEVEEESTSIRMQAVFHILSRCHPEKGGTMYSVSDIELEDTVPITKPLISFDFISPPTPHVHLRDGPPCPICRHPHSPSAFPYAPHVHNINETKLLSIDMKRHRAFSVARDRLRSFYNDDGDDDNSSCYSTPSSTASSSTISSSSATSCPTNSTSTSKNNSNKTPSFKRDCPVCMDSDVICLQLDCQHSICYGCWSEWCAQQDDDSDRSQGNEDAENAMIENMHIEAAKHLELDPSSLEASRIASSCMFDEREKELYKEMFSVLKNQKSKCMLPIHVISHEFANALVEEASSGGRASRARIHVKLVRSTRIYFRC